MGKQKSISSKIEESTYFGSLQNYYKIDKSALENFWKEQKSKSEDIDDLKSISFNWNEDFKTIYLIELIRKGMPYESFKKISANIPLDLENWSKALNVTLRTLEKYKEREQTFSSQQTERIIEIDQLFQVGYEVFDIRENFNSWMFSKSLPLGNASPVSLLDTSIGINMIKDEIGRIEHGLLA